MNYVTWFDLYFAIGYRCKQHSPSVEWQRFAATWLEDNR